MQRNQFSVVTVYASTSDPQGPFQSSSKYKFKAWIVNIANICRISSLFKSDGTNLRKITKVHYELIWNISITWIENNYSNIWMIKWLEKGYKELYIGYRGYNRAVENAFRLKKSKTDVTSFFYFFFPPKHLLLDICWQKSNGFDKALVWSNTAIPVFLHTPWKHTASYHNLYIFPDSGLCCVCSVPDQLFKATLKGTETCQGTGLPLRCNQQDYSNPCSA